MVRKYLQMILGVLSFFNRAEKSSGGYFEKRRFNLLKREGYECKCLLSHEKMIVFDLDENLIHCSESLDDPYDI